MASHSEITEILVIENDRATAKLISKELRKKRWIVNIAHTAQDGVEAYRNGNYDALCIDCVLPDADGLSLIKKLPDWNEHPPVLIMTDAGNKGTVVEALRPGVDDYLIKDDDGKYLDLLSPIIEKIMLHRRDRSERHMAHDELRKSADQSGNTQVSFNEDVGSDARTASAPPRTADMPDHTTDGMMGEKLSDFTQIQGEEPVQGNRNFQDGDARERNNREVTTKNGDSIYASVATAPTCDDESHDIGDIIEIQDIGEQKVREDVSGENELQIGAAYEGVPVPKMDIETLTTADIIDLPAMQSMLELFYELTDIGLAIFDVNGTPLATCWWSDICTKFHRVHPESAKHCRESDVELSTGVAPGEFKLYRCKHNMWDMVTPIMVGDQHVANLFMGQFLFDDEPVDYELFRSQAKTYGFDEDEYLAALERVPRRNRKTLTIVMSFFSELAKTISKLSYSNLKLARTLAERDTLLERLGDSEKRYRRIIDTSPAMIFLVRNEKYIYANPAAARELGYESPEDLIDLPVERLIDLETQPKLLTRMKQVTKNGIANPPMEIRVTRSDGSILISESTSIPIHLDDGDAILMMGRNVTNRKMAETALREYEAKYRELFDTSMDVVFLTTVEGRLVDINRAGEELFGYSREELLTMNIRDNYLNPSDRDVIRNDIAQKGYVKNFEVILKKKDGTPIESIITATGRHNSAGDIIGYQGFIKDITDLKRTQNQLIQAQKMEAIGTLAGGIAHDFNNVLATIMGYSSFLKNKVPCGQELYDGLELIEKASTRASELTSQLLTYTRKTTSEVKAVNINRILSEVHTLISKTFDKSIRIRLNTGENLPTIEGDESQIYQVIMNISVNAQHAMPDGGDLTMETYEETVPDVLEKTLFCVNPGRYVCLKITDTGVGMDPEILSKIYEPYFTTRGDSGGSGLGMSVVFGIVKSHNGYIDIVSKPNRGSEVVILFPVSEKEETQKEIGHVDIDGGTEDILIIDDEIMILHMTRDILEESGYTVRTALSGREGIEMAEKRMPDLVILDLRMPEMDGRHVLKRLIEIDPNVRILMASGYVEEKQKKEILDMGVYGFLQKPFSADDLKKYVRNIFNTPHP